MTKTVGDSDFSVNASVNNGAPLTYKSSNPAVATVDGNGNVHIVGQGQATITVTASAIFGWDGAGSSINITVNP